MATNCEYCGAPMQEGAAACVQCGRGPAAQNTAYPWAQAAPVQPAAPTPEAPQPAGQMWSNAATPQNSAPPVMEGTAPGQGPDMQPPAVQAPGAQPWQNQTMAAPQQPGYQGGYPPVQQPMPYGQPAYPGWQQPMPPPMVYSLAAKKNNGFALAGFILSLVSIVLGMFIIIPLCGGIFSGIGLATFKRTTQGNRWMAVTGLIVSIVLTVLWGLIWGLAIAGA